jgi:hypothetical protein
MNSNLSTVQGKSEFSLKVLNPTAILKFKPLSPAKRLEDLKNKKIGLYWNTKARGDVALTRVKELLSKRFEGMRFQWFETGPVNEASEDWFENVRQSGVNAVIASTGD